MKVLALGKGGLPGFKCIPACWRVDSIRARTSREPDPSSHHHRGVACGPVAAGSRETEPIGSNLENREFAPEDPQNTSRGPQFYVHHPSGPCAVEHGNGVGFPRYAYAARTGPDYRARYYDPVRGRFVSEDPIGLGGGINFYGYGLGNPVRFIDPLGLKVTIVISRTTYTTQSITGTIVVTSDVKGVGKFQGYTLEATMAGDFRQRTPIPPDAYSAFVREDYNPNRIQLNNVPGYAGIQLHNGNTWNNVTGCFAVGKWKSPNEVHDSLAALGEILKIINMDGSGDITVTVIGPNGLQTRH